MTKRFFIMAYSQNGESGMPIVESMEDDSCMADVLFFATEQEAIDIAESMMVCQAFGYKIFSM